MATLTRRGFLLALAAAAACAALPIVQGNDDSERKVISDFAQPGDTIHLPGGDFNGPLKVPIYKQGGTTLRTYVTVIRHDAETKTFWLA